MCMKKQDQKSDSQSRKETETTRTNIVMETPLVSAAQEITGIRTKAGVVHYALKEVVRRSKMKELLSLHGKVAWHGDLNESRKTREF